MISRSVSRLTPKPGPLVPNAAPVFGRTAQQLLTGFSAAEVGQLTAHLERMLTNVHPAE